MTGDMRDSALESARVFNLPKRGRVWLQRLKLLAASAHVDIPEGWEVMEADVVDQPSYKNEKSAFYWLQRAMYSRAFVYNVTAGEEVTIRVPQFPVDFWPMLVIDVADGATVTIVDDYGLPMSEQTPFRGVFVQVGRNAKVQWNGYQHHDEGVISFDHKRFVLGEGARLDYYSNVVGGCHNFDELLVEMVGRGSEVMSQTVFFGHADQQHEMRVNHVHIGEDTTSNMISKGAVGDHSYGGFLGYIQMEPGCSGADGNLEEHNLLLSDTSKIDATPGLEIGHNDVAAAHAAYMERVDDEKLFYLASRGIPKEEAIQVILEGFFLDAISEMGDDEFEQRVFKHILSYL